MIKNTHGQWLENDSYGLDLEVEFARLCEMMSDYDEEAQDE